MPTNQEWLNQLATESPDKLKAWFDAEHNDALAAKNDVRGDAAHSNDGKPHLKASENLSDGFTDSRKQLEADTRKLMRKLYEVGYTDARFNAGLISEADIRLPSFDFDKNRGAKFFALLNRQAAITANENKELIEWQAATVARLQKEVDTIKAANDDYREEVDRLTAERDNLAKDLNDMMRSMDKLCDRFRDASSSALDNAHEIQRIIDNLWTV